MIWYDLILCDIRKKGRKKDGDCCVNSGSSTSSRGSESSSSSRSCCCFCYCSSGSNKDTNECLIQYRLYILNG